jgi:hypothetical protein
MFLVEEKGYAKNDLEPRLSIETLYNGQYVVSTIDITVTFNSRRIMILRFAPGSITTRERSAIAAARILDPDYQIPLAVVTNSRDAVILDTYSAKIIKKGLDSIPAKKDVEQMFQSLKFEPFTDKERIDKERRILNAYDIEICCVGGPCALPGAPEG